MDKKHLNDTNYVLQKSASSRPFVVHVDWMRHFYSDLLKDEVRDLSRISAMPDSSPQPNLAKKPTPVDVTKSDKTASQGKSAYGRVFSIGFFFVICFAADRAISFTCCRTGPA